MQYLSLIYKIEDLEVFKISAATSSEPERPLIGKKTCVHLDQMYLVLTTFNNFDWDLFTCRLTKLSPTLGNRTLTNAESCSIFIKELSSSWVSLRRNFWKYLKRASKTYTNLYKRENRMLNQVISTLFLLQVCFAVISKRVSCLLRLSVRGIISRSNKKRHQHLILINTPLHYRNC